MSRPVLVLLSATMVALTALLISAAAGMLARLDGASYPAALFRAAVTFAGVLTLAAVVTSALAPVLT